MKYFHTFDALRFLAFFIVFLQHLPLKENSILSFFSKSGGIGVQIFFILSGFLITYILIETKKKNQKINIKNFLIRRGLRIWPLYFAMVFFAFFTPFILQFLSLEFSGEGYEPNWIFPFLFLENYEMMWKNDFPNASPLRVMWSLCIEEHFYIIWAVVFYFISFKKLPLFLGLSLIFSLVCRIIYHQIELTSLDLNTNLIYFSSGGILAYFTSFHFYRVNSLQNIPVFIKWLFAVIIVFLFFYVPHIHIDRVILEPLIICFVTILLLSFTLPEKNSLKISNQNIFSRLGKYTYAMYLFHTIWINFFAKFSQNFWLIFSLSLTATILSSILSYYLFENQFLKLKKLFI
ncbi:MULTISPECIES: acyltransferase [Weeksella]|uniref:acyltransferase family protein n=1 Tax=Weeksella TaxID=1013 RepID=UPI0008A1C873|nr:MULTISPECIES: acyltransferase [Weeksella]MDK7374505.1 acyltransferase [Weeksella virosa]OFM81893.1 hypothetical protein HMPREF2660_05945 [Weeksella sp. HMSC059D05]